MKRTMATMIYDGEYRVIYDDSQKINPYRVYYIYRELKDGYGLVTHKKQIVRYADMASCMYHLHSIVENALYRGINYENQHN